jgi:hypothetical protein
MEDSVELADMIGQLRRELSRAMWAGEYADLRFEAEKVELELTVGVERDRSPEARIRILVLDIGAQATKKSMVTQRITLTLRPVLAESPDRAARLAGRELPDEE